MIANPELWTNATFLCWREEMVEVDAVSNEFYLRRVAWSYLKHPDGNNSQCEEEGVEQ